MPEQNKSENVMDETVEKVNGVNFSDNNEILDQLNPKKYKNSDSASAKATYQTQLD